MLDQLFEGFREASESSLQAHQEVFKQWAQLWPSAAPTAAGVSAQWNDTVRRRLRDASTDALNKQRELIDSMFRSGIQVIEQGFGVTGAKSPEDCVRLLGELWRRSSDTLKEQSEARFRDFQKAAETWSELKPQIRT